MPRHPDATDVRLGSGGGREWLEWGQPPYPCGKYVIPCLTRSFEAAVALVEQTLPVLEEFELEGPQHPSCCLDWGDGVAGEDGATYPLAILAALLSALIAIAEREATDASD